MSNLIYAVSFFAFVIALSPGCGVRGKPQPPLTPTELGRGKPTFKRATEEYAFPTVPGPGVQMRPSPTPFPSSNTQDEED